MSKEFHPLVSIVIPVYNGSNYLREAIDSALAQTYDNIEIIVVNDGSKDNTEEIAKSYGDKIRYFAKENGGVSTALNIGIENMRGEYFSWLSHDDIYLPNKISAELNKIMEIKSDNSIIYSAYNTIDQTGKFLQEYHLPPHITENIDCLLALDTTYTLNGCTLLIPRHLLTEDFRFDSKLRYTQDYDLWLRLSTKAQFIYLDECLISSRQHEAQGGRSAGPAVVEEADRLHYKAIKGLSITSVYDYVEGNPSRLNNLYNIYRVNGYTATAAMIFFVLFKLHRHYQNAWIAQNAVQKHLGLRFSAGQRIETLYQQHRDDTRPIVAFYSNVWTTGGIERVLSILFQQLHKRYQIILISGYVPNEQGFPLPDDVIHIKIDLEHTVPISQRLAELSKIMNVDIFVGNPNIVSDFLPTYKILNKLEIRTIASNHYYYFLPYRLEWLRPVAQERHAAFTYADVVLWLTNFSAALCAGYCDHVGVLPNPNTFPAVDPRELPSKKTVLAVGRFFDSLKRIDLIFELFSKIYEKDSEARLVLVGECPPVDNIIPQPVNRSLRSILQEFQLPDSAVFFVGEQKDVRPYYQDASIYLMASDCEGFGMVLTEAGVYGVPVLVYGTPGLEDLIVHGQNGYITELEEIEKASDLAVSLLNDNMLWQQMSLRAQELASRFTASKIADRWDTLFNILLQSDDRPISELLHQKGFTPTQTNPGWLQRISKEYERSTYPKVILAESTSAPLAQTQHVTIPDPVDSVYYQQMLYMQNSFSWRITSPLRKLKTFSKSLFRKETESTRTTELSQEIAPKFSLDDVVVADGQDILVAVEKAGEAGYSWSEILDFICSQTCLESNPEGAAALFGARDDLRTTIVVFSTEWLRGGTERVLSVLLKELAQQYRIVLFTIYTADETGFELSEEITHFRVRRNGTLSLPQRLAALVKLSGAKVFWGNSNLAVDFLPVYSILKNWEIKTIILNHYFYLLPYQNPVFYSALPVRQKAFFDADIVLWLTNYSAALCRGVHDNVGVMPNPNSFSNVWTHTLAKQKIILAVGRFDDPNKRIDRILRVFHLVYQHDPDARLVVVGPCSKQEVLPMPIQKSVAQLMKELHIPMQAVQFKGEQSDVHPYFENASVLLMASGYEGFPMTLTEAGVYGVPSVIFGTPGLEDIIQHGENGYIIGEDAPETAAEKIVELLNNPVLWESMSRRSIELADRFTVDKITDRWKLLFSLILGNQYSSIDVIEKYFAPQNKTVDNLKIISRSYEQLGLELQSTTSSGVQIAGMDTELSTYAIALQYMQNSFSWRITKPLRLLKKTHNSIQTRGLIQTIALIIKKLRNH